METLIPFIVYPIVLILAFLIYFLPSIVASEKKHKNLTAIVILNIFLGWSLLGWVVALVWSVMADSSAAPVAYSAHDPRRSPGNLRTRQLEQQWPEGWGPPPDKPVVIKDRFPDDIPDEWLNP